MKKLIGVLSAALIAVSVAMPAMAHDRYRYQQDDDEAGVAIFLGIVAGVMLDRAIARNEERRYAPRFTFHPRQYRERRSYRRGSGQAVGAGDYCPYRLTYDEYDDRYYCTR